MSEEFRLIRYICEDGDGELFEFLISNETHDRIEEDQGDIVGKYILWDFREKSLRFFG